MTKYIEITFNSIIYQLVNIMYKTNNNKINHFKSEK